MAKGRDGADDLPGTSRPIIWRYLLALIDLYAGFLVVYLSLRAVTTGYLWPVEIVSVVAHWLLLAAIALLPIALLARRWPTVIMLGIVAAAFLGLFGGLFLPPLGGGAACDPDGGAQSLTVMTFNLSNGRADPEGLIRVIKESAAEVVAVQELFADQVPALQEGLRAAYPYQALHGSGIGGIGVVSQYPLIEEALVELAGAHPYLRVAIEVEGRPLTILAAHVPVNFGPGAPDAPARRDIGVVAEMAVAARPAILLGDFNFTDQNVEYQVLTRAGLRDAFRVAGWGLGSTFPLRSRTGEKRVLLYRIDMVLVTEELCVERAWMGADGGSDHLPALATVRW